MKKQPAVEKRSNLIFRNTAENLRYFYHPDHLGYTSWVTDSAKNGIQYCEYLPAKKLRFFSSLAFGNAKQVFHYAHCLCRFGEPFLDQRSTTWNSRYTFSGKERDTETGYSYFGARYYNSDLSIWLSVDPMSDKYPNLTPYTYCANNPIILVDPDGRVIGEVDEASQKKIDALTNKNSADYSKAFTRKFRQLERSKQVYNFYEATESDITTDRQGGVIRSEDGKSIDIITSAVDGARTSPKGGFSKEYATLFEETYHAADYDKGRLDLNNPTCRDEARAWKFAAKAPGTSMRYFDGKYNNYTIAHLISNLSVKSLANGFLNGMKAWIDDNGDEHFTINAKTGGGLYKHLPLK